MTGRAAAAQRVSCRRAYRLQRSRIANIGRPKGQRTARGLPIYAVRIEQHIWDERAAGWDDTAAVRAYAAAAFSSLQEITKGGDIALAGARVVDFGCGTGLLTEQLVFVGAAVDAVDTSTEMLAVLDSKVARHGWTTVKTGTEPPANQRAYDLIVCSSVCSFLDDYPSTITDLVSLLRPGGIFVQWDWERTGNDPGGLSRDEINDALDSAGLIETSVKTGFTISVNDDTMSPLVGLGRRPHSTTTDP